MVKYCYVAYNYYTHIPRKLGNCTLEIARAGVIEPLFQVSFRISHVTPCGRVKGEHVLVSVVPSAP